MKKQKKNEGLLYVGENVNIDFVTDIDVTLDEMEKVIAFLKKIRRSEHGKDKSGKGKKDEI